MRLGPFKLATIAGGLGTLSGFLLTFLGSGGATRLELSDAQQAALLYIALACAAVAIVITAILVVAWSARGLEHRLARRLHLMHRTCTSDDLAEIAVLAQDTFGPQSTSLEQTKRLHGIDPGMFRVVVDQKNDIHGYFCIFRLTRDGVSAIGRNDFSLAYLPIEYVRCDRKHTYCDIYIGAVYGRSRASKAFVLGCVVTQLTGMKPRKIFARAATKDGLRVLEGWGFRPVDQSRTALGSIFVLERS